MLDSCGKHGVTADVKLSDREEQRTYGRMLTGDVKYRFVIDMTTLN
jgi:alcohol dehydrogenase (NADP+)